MAAFRRVAAWLLALLATCGADFALAETPALDPVRVTQLIAELGHRLYSRREQASKQLEAMGERVIPILRDASVNDPDLEIRQRAEQVFRRIMLAGCKSRSTGLELAFIDAGAFSMGSPNSETNRRPDEEFHRVRISRPFLIGVHEVQQEQFEQVMKFNPSWFAETGEGKLKVKDVPTTARFPVESVTWFDAVDFCNRLSRRDGLVPYYKLTDLKQEEDAIASATVEIAGGSGYRLPTEAEWEYACRAGTVTPFHFGAANSGREANLKAYVGGGGYGGPPTLVELGRAARTGSYLPNPAGLCDMHANVAEWCGDWYDKDYYGKSPPADPTGPAMGVQRVVRGGSWLVNEASCRSASRYWIAPGDRNNYTGFRVCRGMQ